MDAIGELDGKRCLLEWKTTASRLSGGTGRTTGLGSSAGLLFLGDKIADDCPRHRLFLSP
jgi:hypothetical protein